MRCSHCGRLLAGLSADHQFQCLVRAATVEESASAMEEALIIMRQPGARQIAPIVRIFPTRDQASLAQESELGDETQSAG